LELLRRRAVFKSPIWHVSLNAVLTIIGSGRRSDEEAAVILANDWAIIEKLPSLDKGKTAKSYGVPLAVDRGIPVNLDTHIALVGFDYNITSFELSTY